MVWKALWPVLLGIALAIALWPWARWFERRPREAALMTENPVEKAAVACGNAVERMERALRSWQAAGISLLVLVSALGAAVFLR
jgi:predicted PurR-regulated permease PerM